MRKNLEKNINIVAPNIEIITKIDGVKTLYNCSDKLFDIASLTKIVTTFLILKLVFADKIKLDDKVSQFIDCKHDIKIRELLLHKSGLQDVSSKEFNLADDFISSNKKEINYADSNFICLYKICESLGGFELLLKKYILLGDLSSNILFSKNQILLNCHPTENKPTRGLVRGIVHDEKCFKMNGVSAHAGLFTSIESFSNLLDTLLVGDFKIFVSKILKQHQLATRTLGFLTHDKQMGHLSNHGYFHTGFTGTSLYLDEKLSDYLLVFTNRIFPNRDNITIFEFRTNIHNQFFFKQKLDK